MRILGVDPSITSTGIAVVDMSELHPRLLECRAVTRPPVRVVRGERILEDRAETLHRIRRSVVQMGQRWTPGMAVIEKIPVHRGRGIDEAVGVCREACREVLGEGSMVLELGSQWTARLGIKGKRDTRKATAAAMFRSLFQVCEQDPDPPDDIVDAALLCVAAAGLVEVQED